MSTKYADLLKIKIHASFPEKLMKVSDLTMLKKVKINLGIITLSGLFQAETHPPSKFHGNLFISFCYAPKNVSTVLQTHLSQCKFMAEAFLMT